MNKKAIELSINFLVIIIISIVILSSGLLIIKRYFSTAEDIKTQLDEQTILQIGDLLDEGEIVAMPINRKVIKPGEVAIFGVGVLNVNQGTTVFTIDIAFSKLVQKDKSVLTDIQGIDPDAWYLYERGFTLDFKENKKVPVRVEVPGNVLSGTYIYNVNVNANNAQYGLTKMYVLVP